jgi:hypothetical protein
MDRLDNGNDPPAKAIEEITTEIEDKKEPASASEESAKKKK